MLLHLSDLCTRSEQEYEILKRHTDSCAEMGRSYELRCAMPALCTPTEAALGFCRTGSQYRLYIRPQVSYRGSNQSLAELFSPGMRSFPTFHAMTTQLHRWGCAISGTDQSVPVLCRHLRSVLEQQVMGQPQATEIAAHRIYSHICKKAPARPLSLVLHGPTGTGKTELCKAIASALTQLFPAAPYQFIRTDLNTYTEAHSVARLIGSPPGYIGYDDQPILESVCANPRTVFLFDELEKAHSEVLKIFMAILDEGRCTAHRDNKEHDRELDFRRCIFLFTTNLDLSSAAEHRIGFSAPSKSDSPHPSQEKSSALHQLQRDDVARRAMVHSGILREIAGRFTGFLPFYPLDETSKLAITAKQISTLGAEFGLHILSISPEIVSALNPTDSFSVRSSVAILENILTPVFLQHNQTGNSFVHLLGTVERMKLVADRRQSSGEQKNTACQ